MPRRVRFTPEKITTLYEQKVAQRVRQLQSQKITNESLNLITNITDDMRIHIRDLLREGEEEGRSVAATASKLLTTGLDKGVFRSARKRAWLIARTELHRARQQAAIAIYQANNIHVVKWVGVADDRICNKCSKKEGRVFNLEKLLEKEQLPPIHPRCRCRIIPSDFEMSIRVKHDHEGKVLETKISATPRDYKYIIRLKKALEEELAKLRKSKHDYSSTQVELPTSVSKQVMGVLDKIDREDLHPTEKQDDDFHITVRYGLFTNNSNEVELNLDYPKTLDVSILGVEVFSPEDKDYDVLVLRVDSPDLNILNEKLGELPHTDTYPVYQPHITICYLKRGMGEKYRNLVTGLEGTNLSFKKVVFSPTKGNKVSIDLEKSEYLEKAKPYTRTRLGKLERVKGYPGRGPGFSKPSFWDQRSWNKIADSSTTQSKFYNKERLLLAYQSPADVHEGYTIGQHTEMVMRQFDKYFSNKDIPILGVEGMRQLLAIHDIGKFDASRNGKPSSEQYIFNPGVVHDVFNQLKFSEKAVKVAEALVSQNLIGRYLTFHGIPKLVVVRKLAGLAEEAGVSLKDFYELAKIFYMSDASSYTEDAGGQKSLEYLFKFPSEYRAEQEYKLPLEFSDMYKERMNKLDLEVKYYKEDPEGAFTFYHGTSQAYLKKIIEEGLVSQKYHNFDSGLYGSGERTNSIFVAESVMDAAFFANQASSKVATKKPMGVKELISDEPDASIILKVRIPKDYFFKNRAMDEEWGGSGAWLLPVAKPEWIEKAVLVKSLGLSDEEKKEIEKFTGDTEEKNKFLFERLPKVWERVRKSKNDFITLYIPISVDVWAQIEQQIDGSGLEKSEVSVKPFRRVRRGKLEAVKGFTKTVSDLRKELVKDKKIAAQKHGVDPNKLHYEGPIVADAAGEYIHTWTVEQPGHPSHGSTISGSIYKIPLEKIQTVKRVPKMAPDTPSQKVERFLDHNSPDVKLAYNVASEVDAIGGKALFVGGCVRDALLGRTSKDVDIEVYGISSEDLGDLLSRLGKVDAVGSSFGVLKLSRPELNQSLDISIPRRDSKTGVGHKGFIVETDPTMTIREAARRRDLTINALAYDPIKKEVIDEFGGLKDLENKKLRATDPETFVEDPLRVLRVMQFAARFGFTPDTELVRLCRGMDLNSLPKERVFGEVEKLLLKSQTPSIGLRLMSILGVTKILPEIEALRGVPQDVVWHPEGDAWKHTMMVVDKAVNKRRLFNNDRDKLALMLGALCHDMGKPQTTDTNEEGRITSYSHDSVGAEVARQFMDRITNEKELTEKVVSLVAHHMKPTFFYHDKVSDSAVRRLSKKVDIPMLVALSMSDKEGRETAVDLKAENWMMEKYKELKLDQPDALAAKVMGRHLISLGVPPGPEMGKVLNQIYEAQLEGKFQTAEEGVDWAKREGLIGIFTYEEALREVSVGGTPETRQSLVEAIGREPHKVEELQEKIRKDYGDTIRLYRHKKGKPLFGIESFFEDKKVDESGIGYDTVMDVPVSAIVGHYKYFPKAMWRSQHETEVLVDISKLDWSRNQGLVKSKRVFVPQSSAHRAYYREDPRMVAYHWTSEAGAKHILKEGFKPGKRPVFGKGAYLSLKENAIVSATKSKQLKMRLAEDLKFNTDYNSEDAYEKLTKLKKEIYPKDLSDYFKEKGFDGLDLSKFSFEPQLVIYNTSKIQDVEKLQKESSKLKVEIRDLKDEFTEKVEGGFDYDRWAMGSRAPKKTKKMDPETEATLKKLFGKSHDYVVDFKKSRKNLVALRKSKLEGKKVPYRLNGHAVWSKVYKGGFIVKGKPELVTYDSRVLLKSGIGFVTGIGKDGVIARDKSGRKYQVFYKNLNLWMGDD